MLTAVYLIGKLGPKADSLVRTVKVLRPYKEDMKNPTIDDINVMYWSENTGAVFYRGEENQLVSLKGRLEVRNHELLVIAEQVNFIEKE